MDLKGGVAYLNMRGADIYNTMTPENSVFVENLYRDANKIYESKKICVLYNAGSLLSNIAIPATCYVKIGDSIVIKLFLLSTAGTGANRTIWIKPDSTYYVANS